MPNPRLTLETYPFYREDVPVAIADLETRVTADEAATTALNAGPRLATLESEAAAEAALNLGPRVSSLESSVGTPTSLNFLTRSAAAAAVIPIIINFVTLAGYATAGDNGRNALYKRVSTQPVHAGTFTDGLGNFWEYQPEARGVSAGAFGVKADYATDDWQSAQNAIDFATYFAKRPVYFPAGRMLYSRPLLLGYGDLFEQTILEAAGPRFRGDPQESGTSFHATYNNAPGLVAQGQRKCIVRGIALIGQNYQWIANNALAKKVGTDVPPLDDTIYANWIDSSFPASSSSRYAPYAAVAIDAYSGTRPGVSYPDVPYPAWTGITTQYGKAPSSDILLEDCYIYGWVVGLAITPSDWDSNSDFVKAVRCTFDSCADMLSVGPTQSRNVFLDNCIMSTAHTLITTSRHGKQQGTLAGVAINCGFGEIMNLLDVAAPPYAGPFTFIGCYGEAMWSLGRWGGSAGGNKPLVYMGGKLSFDLQTPARGYPLYMLAAGAPTPVSFRDVSFANFKSIMSFGGAAEGYIFENCELLAVGEDTAVLLPYQQLAKNFLASGLALPPSLTLPWPDRVTVKGYRYDQSVSYASSEKVGDVVRSKRDIPVPAVAEQAFPYFQPGVRHQLPPPWSSIDKGGEIASYTRSGTTLTIVFSGRPDSTFMKSGGLPGDVLIETTGEVYFVRSRVGQTVLAELQNGYKVIAGVYTYANPLVASGTLYVGNSRIYTPYYFLRGDISTTSPSIVNAGLDNGNGAWIPSEIQVGDYAYVDDLTDQWINPVNAAVVAVAAGSITLAANSAKTQAGRSFPRWIRQPPPNV